MAGFFPMISARGTLGVKLFLQKIPELAVRYEAIDQALNKLASPNFIKIEYREGPNEGAVWGAEYTPYLKMEFVRGVVIKDEVERLAGRRDAHRLLGLAEQWQKIALMMERESIAHGDIQAENLMVEPSGRIRLIDLDTMFVPSLRARRLRCVAYGIPGWQHPRKETDERHFDERMDRFPSLAMYLCLLALADDPCLFNPAAVSESEILFTKEDFRDPNSSSVLRRLSGSSNAEIRRVTEALVQGALGKYDDVPAFSNVADPDAEAKEALQQMQAAVRTADHRRVCKAWKPVLEKYPPAQALRGELNLARKHLEKTERFCRAAASDDDKELAEIWQTAPSLEQCACCNSEQVAPGVSVAVRAAQAVKRVEGMEVVRRAIEAAEAKKGRSGHYEAAEELGIVEAWNDSRYDLSGSHTATEVYWKRVEEAWNRLAAFKEFETALGTDDDEKIAKTWQQVSTFAPALVHQKRAEEAIARMRVLEGFLNQVRQDSNDDRALWRIWSGRTDMGQCMPAARAVAQLGGIVPSQRAMMAGRRVEGMEVVGRAIAVADRRKRETGYYQGPEESGIVSAWGEPRYDLAACKAARETLWGRVEEAQKRLAAYKDFESALETDDDEKIADAWQLTATFASALRNQTRAEDGIARMKLLAAFLAQLREDGNDDQALWNIWSARADMEQCKPAGRPVAQLGGLIPAQRGVLSGRRVAALAELKRVFEQRDRPPFGEAGEREMMGAWRQKEAILGPSPAGGVYRKRADEAQRRLKAWEALQKGVREDDDEQIAASWETGLLSEFVPAQVHSGRAKESVERMSVIGALAGRLRENSEDEEGLIRVASGRLDMERCRSFLKANPALNGLSWQERIEHARQILVVRSAVTRVLSAVPLQYDKLADVWNDKLCRGHHLFAADLRRIDEVLELGAHLVRLRQGLGRGDCGLISSAWREEFRNLMGAQELDAIRDAMHRHFTGPTCIERVELALADGVLTARWEWCGSASLCYLEVREGAYPEACSGVRPNGFRGEATGGLLTMPFSGSSPCLRAWAMFRFLDKFFLGAEPVEKRLVTVEYEVSKPLLRKHRLTLSSLSGRLTLPALAVIVSENPVWPRTEEAQRIPEMVLEGAHTLELSLPPTITRGERLYLSLRPVERSNEEWLRLRPGGGEAVVIHL